jgi:uncharacterized protein (DUF302 family)
MNETIPTLLGLTVRLETDFATAQERTVEALKAEGFGVLTEIDVKETLQKKLGVDFRPYKILGACNPILAHRALELAPEVGLLLPCNVTLSQLEQGVIEVSIIDPLVMLGVVERMNIKPVAEEARAQLERVTTALSQWIQP